MPEVFRISGFVYFFYSNERNEPLHVHVRKAGGYAKFWIEPVGLDFSKGFKTSDLAQAEQIILNNIEIIKGNGMISLETDIAVVATAVWIENNFVCIRLADEREIRFPISKNLRLAKASSEQLKNIELICGGTGLHWSEIDEDLSVLGILEGRFG